MGRPLVGKGDLSDSLDGLPTKSVEISCEPGGIVQVRVHGVHDAMQRIDEGSRDTAQDIRERLNDPEKRDGGW
ncbi:MAG: hypothetical protein WC840_03175 [Candidatus Peribacteraceae bacterium]